MKAIGVMTLFGSIGLFVYLAGAPNPVCIVEYNNEWIGIFLSSLWVLGTGILSSEAIFKD